MELDIFFVHNGTSVPMELSITSGFSLISQTLCNPTNMFYVSLEWSFYSHFPKKEIVSISHQGR